MRTDSYLTISGQSEGEYKEKGSKFIAFSFPVSSIEEFKEYMVEIKKSHYAARHYCYAYRIGSAGEIARANDDGEPAHTAGDPILNQIRSNNITNVGIIVVRYFGGTKLGKSGLINAYKAAANDSIAQARIIRKTITQNVLISFEYESLNEIMRQIKALNIALYQQSYSDSCQVGITIDASDLDLIHSVFQRIPGIKSIEVLPG